MSSPPATPPGARRVIVCDYSALLQSVTGLLRMSGYCVFQAYDGQAAQELCEMLPDIELLVLNTDGTGTDTADLVRSIRTLHPGLPVLHVGPQSVPGLPSDVPSLSDTFDSVQLLAAVRALVPQGS